MMFGKVLPNLFREAVEFKSNTLRQNVWKHSPIHHSFIVVLILILLPILYCLSLFFRVFDLLMFENSSSDSNFMKVIEYVLSLKLVINIQLFHIYYMLTNLIYPYRIYTIITVRKSVEFNISQLLCIHYIVIWPEVGHFSK